MIALVIAAPVVTLIGVLLLFVEVETVVISGPILAGLGVCLLLISLYAGFGPGIFLAASHVAVPTICFVLVAALNWSPSEAFLPLLLIGSAYLVLLVPATYHAHTRIPRFISYDHCDKCGYSLRGLTEPRCPECGTPFSPARLNR